MNEAEVQEKTDEELITLVKGDQRHFSHIIQRYQTKLMRYIMRISNVSYQEAEDILQEVFIKVYTNMNDFDTSLSFSSWMYRITHNQVISNHRKNNARAHGHLLDVQEDVVHMIADDFNMNETVDQQYLKEHIQEILEKLDDKYREILVLRFFQEKSYQEISDILQKPPGTVATLINRAKKECKKLL